MAPWPPVPIGPWSMFSRVENANSIIKLWINVIHMLNFTFLNVEIFIYVKL